MSSRVTRLKPRLHEAADLAAERPQTSSPPWPRSTAQRCLRHRHGRTGFPSHGERPGPRCASESRWAAPPCTTDSAGRQPSRAPAQRGNTGSRESDPRLGSGYGRSSLDGGKTSTTPARRWLGLPRASPPGPSRRVRTLRVVSTSTRWCSPAPFASCLRGLPPLSSSPRRPGRRDRSLVTVVLRLLGSVRRLLGYPFLQLAANLHRIPDDGRKKPVCSKDASLGRAPHPECHLGPNAASPCSHMARSTSTQPMLSTGQ